MDEWRQQEPHAALTYSPEQLAAALAGVTATVHVQDVTSTSITHMHTENTAVGNAGNGLGADFPASSSHIDLTSPGAVYGAGHIAKQFDAHGGHGQVQDIVELDCATLGAGQIPDSPRSSPQEQHPFVQQPGSAGASQESVDLIAGQEHTAPSATHINLDGMDIEPVAAAGVALSPGRAAQPAQQAGEGSTPGNLDSLPQMQTEVLSAHAQVQSTALVSRGLSPRALATAPAGYLSSAAPLGHSTLPAMPKEVVGLQATNIRWGAGSKRKASISPGPEFVDLTAQAAGAVAPLRASGTEGVQGVQAGRPGSAANGNEWGGRRQSRCVPGSFWLPGCVDAYC